MSYNDPYNPQQPQYQAPYQQPYNPVQQYASTPDPYAQYPQAPQPQPQPMPYYQQPVPVRPRQAESGGSLIFAWVIIYVVLQGTIILLQEFAKWSKALSKTVIVINIMICLSTILIPLSRKKLGLKLTGLFLILPLVGYYLYHYFDALF